MRSTIPILVSLALAAAVSLPARAHAAATFAAPTSTTVSDKPEGVALADFTGDGTLDAAVGNRDQQSVDILIGGPAGLTVAPGSPVSTGHNLPVSVQTGDLNGDGKVDVVSGAAVGSDKGVVSVLLGDGTGHFTPATGSPFKTRTDGPDSQSAIALGDMDGDGDVDVVVAGGSTEIGLLKNDGHGVLAEGVPSEVGFDTAETVAIADVTGDALPDVVAAAQSGTGNVFKNTAGVLAFESVVTGIGQDVAAGQIDGADRDDLLFALMNDGKVTTFLSTPDTGLTKHGDSLFSGDFFANSIRLADIDADGNLDAAVAADAGIPVLKGDGKGGFAALPNTPIEVAKFHSGVAVGDVTGDAQPDVVFTTSDNDTVHVARNEQIGAATGTPSVDFGTHTEGAVADAVVTLTSSGPGFYRVGSAVPSGAGITKTSDSCTGVALAVGKSCTIGLRFTAQTTKVTGTLAVSDNAGNRAIPLTGSGEAKQVFVPLPVPDTTRPILKDLKATRTSLGLRMSEPGSVAVTIEKKVAGKKKGAKCVAPSRKLRKARSCTRYAKVRTVSQQLTGGQATLRFKKLGKGSYRFTVVGKDTAGNVAAPVRTTLKVKK